MGNTRIDIQTAIDAHFFKPLPPLSFSQKPLQIRVQAPASVSCRSAPMLQPPVIADPRPAAPTLSCRGRHAPATRGRNNRRPGDVLIYRDYSMNEDLIPEGPPLGLTPILAVSDAHAAIAFYARAFGATELARIAAPGTSRLMHVRMLVLGTVFVFMDEIPELAAEESGFHSPDRLRGTSVTLHLQVADAESVWRQALDAGALSVIQLAKQFWGELYGRLKDPSGHEWTIAQMLDALASDEVENAARAHLTAREQ